MDISEQNAAAIEAIKSRAFGVRLTLFQLCGRAGVAYSTLHRAKGRDSPLTPGTLLKLENKLDELEAERAAKQAAQASPAAA